MMNDSLSLVQLVYTLPLCSIPNCIDLRVIISLHECDIWNHGSTANTDNLEIIQASKKLFCVYYGH